MSQKADLSLKGLRASDKEVKEMKKEEYEKFSHAASDAAVAATKKALEAATHKCTVVGSKKEALQAILALKDLKTSSYGQAASTTLHEIGWIDYVKEHPDCVGRNTMAEKLEAMGKQDMAKAAEAQKAAFVSDYFFTSCSAITESGEILAADLTGTRVGGFLGTSSNLIVVTGSNKIVKDLAAANERLEKFCLPFESARARAVYGVPGSSINNVAIIKGPNPWGAKGRVHVIIVKESLGF
eukprot:g73419.t1